MKRLFLTLAATAAICACTAFTPVKAASPTITRDFFENLQNCSDAGAIILSNCEDNAELKSLLEKCGVSLDSLLENLNQNGFGCEIIIPDSCLPVTPSPEAPDSSVTPSPEMPDSSAPVTPTPEPSLPEDSEDTEDSEGSTDSDGSEDSEEGVHPYVLRIVELVNEERAKEGLNPVTLDTNASNAALVRSKEIVNSFSHTRPNGSSFTTALKEQGVSYRTAGENIAWGQRSPEQVMEAWMNSSGHRANIMNASYTHIGVGYYQVNGVNYWTQLFFG